MDNCEYGYHETGQEHLGDNVAIGDVETVQDNPPAVDDVNSYNTPRTSTPNEVDSVSRRLGRVSLSSNDSIDDCNYGYTSSISSGLDKETKATASSQISTRHTHQPHSTGHVHRQTPIQPPELHDTISSGSQPQYAYTTSTEYNQMQYYPGLGSNYTQQPQYDVHQDPGTGYTQESPYGYQDTGSDYTHRPSYMYPATGTDYGQNAHGVQARGQDDGTAPTSNPIQGTCPARPRHGSRNPVPSVKSSSTPRKGPGTFTRSRGQNQAIHPFENSNSRYLDGSFPQPDLSVYGSNYNELSEKQSSIVGVSNSYDHQQRPSASGPVPSSSAWTEYGQIFDSNETLVLQSPIEDGDDEQLDQLADKQMLSITNMQADRHAYALSKGKSPDTQYSKHKTPKRSNDPRFDVHLSSEFWSGRVLKIEWSEPMGANAKANAQANAQANASSIAYSTKPDDVFTKNRRFIILEHWEGHSIGVPILTYGNQGCKPHAHPECHGIVYTGKRAPPLLHGEAQLGFTPIRMITENDNMDRLQKASRVNFTKKYTIEHNYRVHFVGYIDRTDYMRLQDELQSKHDSRSVFKYGGQLE